MHHVVTLQGGCPHQNISLAEGFWHQICLYFLYYMYVHLNVDVDYIKFAYLNLMFVFTDLTGSQDGSVRLWEWGHNQCITVARQPGSFPKVSKVMFNAQGNKVCLCIYNIWLYVYFLLSRLQWSWELWEFLHLCHIWPEGYCLRLWWLSVCLSVWLFKLWWVQFSKLYIGTVSYV